MYVPPSKALLHNSPRGRRLRCATPTTRSGDSIGPWCYVISICAPCTLQTWWANHRYPLWALEVEDSVLKPSGDTSDRVVLMLTCVDVLTITLEQRCARISILFPSACRCETVWNADPTSPIAPISLSYCATAAELQLRWGRRGPRWCDRSIASQRHVRWGQSCQLSSRLLRCGVHHIPRVPDIPCIVLRLDLFPSQDFTLLLSNVMSRCCCGEASGKQSKRN